MSRLVVATLVLLITVGSLFAAAAWNRGGDVQTIVLTERELALPWSWPSSDSDARLRFQWQGRDDPQDARVWLNDVKLREIGFTTGVPAGALEAEQFYGRSLPRLAWVAFELGGADWQQMEQRRRMTRRAGPERHFVPAFSSSRLVPIDAGLEPAILRRRYQGREVVVLPAVIAMRYRNLPNEGPSVWAVVEALVPGEVSIPAHLRGRLPAAPLRSTLPAPDGGEQAPPPEPRYSVELHVGRLGAPWVADVRALRIE